MEVQSAVRCLEVQVPCRLRPARALRAETSGTHCTPGVLSERIGDGEPPGQLLRGVETELTHSAGLDHRKQMDQAWLSRPHERTEVNDAFDVLDLRPIIA